MNSVIKIQNLIKYFGKTKAVNGVSLEIQKGEIFGFLGPNGAGKTTTIRCMMDFIRPTSGEIDIAGLNAQRDSVKLKQKIGYLSSDIHLYDSWTGKDHLNFIQNIKGKSKIVGDLIKRFGFNQKSKVKSLSTGNKQKLALILTLMNEPEVLILDEPTRGLDPILQQEIYKILREFQAKGATVFMSSHNLPEVEHICDKVAIIRDGKLVAVDLMENITKKKVHLVNAYFEGKFDEADFQLKGVEITDQNHGSLVFRVKGDINPLVKKISQYKLADLEITHATLEEMFMEFYKH